MAHFDCSLVAASRTAVGLFSLQASDDRSAGLQPVLQHEMPVGLQQPLVDFSWLPGDNGLMISSHGNGLVHLWESGSLSIIDTIRLPYQINGHDLSTAAGASQPSLAVAHDTGVVVVDLRAGAAVQTFSFKEGKRPICVSWDPWNAFDLYSGCLDSSIHKLDIRKPRGCLLQVHCPSGPVSNADYPFFLDWVGPDAMVAIHGSGFAFRLSPSSQEVVWRSDLGYFCMEGFQGALVDDTVNPMLILPGSDCISALDLHDGSELWQKACLGFTSDAVLYNPDRLVRFSRPVIHFVGIVQLCP